MGTKGLCINEIEESVPRCIKKMCGTDTHDDLMFLSI